MTFLPVNLVALGLILTLSTVDKTLAIRFFDGGSAENNNGTQEEKQQCKIAVFALGSFWRGEAVFGCLPGVVRTTAGYSGGTKVNPEYRLLGDHAEAVQVEYDPKLISYEQLLDVFWSNHDATQVFGQGPDVGDQYRSIVFTNGKDEAKLAATSKEREQTKLIDNLVTTQIQEFETFYPAEPEHQVITDAAPVCQRAGKMIEQKYKNIFWTPCCVHALNNALKDIGKIDWVKEMVAQARDMQMFICNHHTSLALFRTFSKKEFIKPGDTRYATYFILLERMIEVQDALQSMVVCTEWKRWPESRTEEGKKIRDKVLDDTWWTQAKYVVSVVAPIVAVIRYADTDAPSLGEIYETFDSMLEEIKRIIAARDPDLLLYEGYIRPIVQKRWNKMNTPLHMAAYAVNPKWFEPRPGRVLPHEDVEVREGFLEAIRKIYDKECSSIRVEWLNFANLNGPRFSHPECREDRATIAQSNPIGWWQLYGDNTPNLKHFAIRLLSQVASSSAAERNWSTYSFIHSVRRNRLTSRRAEKLVAVHSSLRLRERVKPEYKQSPATRWDVDPEDAAQIDEDDSNEGLVGVSLEDLHLDDEGSSSNSDSLFDSDSPTEDP